MKKGLKKFLKVIGLTIAILFFGGTIAVHGAGLSADYYETIDGITVVMDLKEDLPIIKHYEDDGNDMDLIWFDGLTMRICGTKPSGNAACSEFIFSSPARLAMQKTELWQHYAPGFATNIDYMATHELVKRKLAQ